MTHPAQFSCFVGNLPFHATREDVFAHFNAAARVKSVRLAFDKVTLDSRGFAFVQVHDQTGMDEALALDGTELLGRRLTVRVAEERARPAGLRAESCGSRPQS